MRCFLIGTSFNFKRSSKRNIVITVIAVSLVLLTGCTNGELVADHGVSYEARTVGPVEFEYSL